MVIVKKNWTKQLKKARKNGHSTLLGMTNVPATELAEKLIQISPEKLTRVFY